MRPKLLLILILLGGFLLRFISVTDIPALLNRDEAALAYNAYLLQETGQDEWGRSWPLALESFGDYKLPGYPLLLIGSYTLFGVNDLAVRAPSILAGTILIGLTYWLLKIFKQSDFTALTGALLVAVTPVFIFYSRIAFEANVALTLVIFALCMLFYKHKKYRHLLDITAGVVLLLAAFTYNTPLLLLPVIALTLIIYRGVKNYQNWLLPVLSMGGIFIGVAYTLLPLMSRKSAITIFTDPTVWTQFVEYRTSLPTAMQPIIGNKYVYYGQIIIRNFLNSFGPYFLLQQGGSHPWHSIPGWGHVSVTAYLSGLVGLGYALISAVKKHNKELGSLFILSIGGLAPAVVTVDAPHTTRSLLFLYIFVIFAAFCIKILTQKLSNYTTTAVARVAFTALIFFGSAPYIWSYFSQYKQTQVGIYQVGYQEKLKETSDVDEVYVLDRGGYRYVLTAWYLQLSAPEYFNTVERGNADVIGFKYGERVGQYRFVQSPKEDHRPLLYWSDDTEQWIIKN